MRKPAAVRKGKKLPAPVRILLPAVLWLGLWWILSAAVDREVLIPSPPAVLDRLIHLLATAEFYASVGMSVLRVTAGFAAGILLGSALGLFCAQFRIADAAVSPVMSVIRSTPVASVIILALVWIRKDFIPGLISALMVMPVLFGNVREGYFAADPSLLEMADLFRLKRSKIWSKIRLPAMLPFFAAGVKTSIGLAWKAGVAAEVLSLAAHSIGSHLYQSKIYLETADMFAWTLVVILLSFLIEKGLTAAVGRFGVRTPSNRGKPVPGKEPS